MGFANCPKNLPIKVRFERFFKQEPGKCWVWLGHRDAKGYGRFQTKTPDGRPQNERTHRAAFKIYKGPIPEGLQVLHSCDNSGCVNPDHLSLGTNHQNQIEAWARDRKKNVRKLGPDDVIFIRSSRASHQELAERFGVCKPQISKIRSGTRGIGIMRMVQAEGGVPSL